MQKSFPDWMVALLLHPQLCFQCLSQTRPQATEIARPKRRCTHQPLGIRICWSDPLALALRIGPTCGAAPSSSRLGGRRTRGNYGLSKPKPSALPDVSITASRIVPCHAVAPMSYNKSLTVSKRQAGTCSFVTTILHLVFGWWYLN